METIEQSLPLGEERLADKETLQKDIGGAVVRGTTDVASLSEQERELFMALCEADDLWNRGLISGDSKDIFTFLEEVKKQHELEDV